MATKASFHWDDPFLLEAQLSADERQVRVSLTVDGQALASRAASVPRAFAEKTGLQLSELGDLRDILNALRDRLKPAKA